MTPLLLAVILAACVPDHPTPTLQFDPSPSPDMEVAGYGIEYRQPGGSWQLAAQLPTERNDLDDDGTLETNIRRGVETHIPPFRYYNGTPNTLYEFRVFAYSAEGPYYLKSDRSNMVSACHPVYCVRGSPCN